MTSGVEWTLSQFKPVSPHQQFVLFVSDIVVINSDWFLGYFVGNTMWLIAISYYLYITFLGYNSKSCSRLNMLVVFTFFARSWPICCFQGWYLIISNQGYGKPNILQLCDTAALNFSELFSRLGFSYQTKWIIRWTFIYSWKWSPATSSIWNKFGLPCLSETRLHKNSPATICSDETKQTVGTAVY